MTKPRWHRSPPARGAFPPAEVEVVELTGTSPHAANPAPAVALIPVGPVETVELPSRSASAPHSVRKSIREQRERLKRGLDGHWEYICRVTSDTPFERDERGRGGRMTITVTMTWLGMDIDIDAQRLWATTDPDDAPAKRVPVATSIPWKADGGVLIKDGRLSFVYFAKDFGGRGVTKDMLRISPLDGGIILAPGEFTHLRKDGLQATGVVQLRKMNHALDFQWAPKGIQPLETSVPLPDGTIPIPTPVRKPEPGMILASIGSTGNLIIGNVGGGAEKPPLKEVRLLPGNLQKLEEALHALEVPSGDVQAIARVVQAERPLAKTLGPRAADWVGGMVSRSLTGTWAVGKYISHDVLSEMLKSYYGILNRL